MVVTWQNNPFLQPTRPPGFVSFEEWGQETPTGLPNTPVGGVGAPDQTPPVAPLFTPADATGNGMFGGDGGGGNAQPNQPEGDFPSASSIERRRKLAEALMGKQMEVNHPMQAVANAVSQIAGAWMNKKADDEQAQLEKRRRDYVQGGFEKSGGDFDAMMDEWMKSGDPELVDKALDYKLRKAAAAADGGDAPTTRNFYEGNAVVTKQWNPETKQWETVGSPSPRWKASGGVDDGGEDFGPVSAPVSAPADGEEGAVASDPVYATPGPRGKYALKAGPQMTGQDGRPVYTTYNPNDGNYYYRGEDGMWRVASGQRAVAPMTEQQFYKLKLERQDEINGLKALKKYFETVKDIPTGIQRWSIDVTAKFKTFLGQQGLTPDEFNLLDSKAKVQALLGMFRTTIVGPGVMTEYDAIRVLQALGGDPASALQNPEVMREILNDLYMRKRSRAQEIQQTYEDQLRARGQKPDGTGLGVPEGLEEGPENGAPSAPSTPRTPRPSGSKVVLPPVEKRIIGKTEYKAPDGSTYVWGRDASGKVGWMPK